MLEYVLLAKALHGNSNASADAASAKATARSAAGAGERLEQRVAALELTLETILRTMIDSGRMSEEEFFRLMHKIDEEDGRIDGRRDTYKLRRQCPKCRKFSGGDKGMCMWCGADVRRVKAVRVE